MEQLLADVKIMLEPVNTFHTGDRWYVLIWQL